MLFYPSHWKSTTNSPEIYIRERLLQIYNLLLLSLAKSDSQATRYIDQIHHNKLHWYEIYHNKFYELVAQIRSLQCSASSTSLKLHLVRSSCLLLCSPYTYLLVVMFGNKQYLLGKCMLHLLLCSSDNFILW